METTSFLKMTSDQRLATGGIADHDSSIADHQSLVANQHGQHELRQRRAGGSMLMEFVLTMPLLFIMIMGVLQVAHIWTARLVTHYAAFCAARATLTTNEWLLLALSLDPDGPGSPAHDAARQVCAWVVFSDGDENSNDLFSIPGWGEVPHSAELNKRVRVYPRVGPAPLGGAFVGAPWLSGATVQFDFPLLIPVVGTMMGWLAKNDSRNADFAIGSGWSGQSDYTNDDRIGDTRVYEGPYLTLTETVWLPKTYSTKRYPVSPSAMGF